MLSLKSHLVVRALVPFNEWNGMEFMECKSFIRRRKHTKIHHKKRTLHKLNKQKKTIKHKTRRALLTKVSIGHLNLHNIREAVTAVNAQKITY